MYAPPQFLGDKVRFDLSKFPVSGGLLLGLSLGILGVSLTLTFLPSQDYRQAYGRTLAELTARYSAEEVFYKDLVAQQSLLTELVNYPQVGLATIHDAQQKLKVQAGNTHLAQLPTALTFSAPIQLHDRVSGYVRVTIVEPLNAKANIQASIIWAGSLLLLLAVWVILRSGAIHFQRTKKTAPPHVEQAEQKLVEAPFTGQSAYAFIDIQNVRLLKQQLSVGVYNNTLARLEKIIHRVLASYNGTLRRVSDGKLELTFEEQHATDHALLEAICASHLVIELANTNHNIPLELGILVCTNKDDLDSGDEVKLPTDRVVLNITDSESATLQAHLNIAENSSPYKVVSQFAATTVQRLEQQYQQLLSEI